MLVVRAARELWLFLPPRRRRAQFTMPHDGAASLGHVVQALGIPLTEVGALVVDGVPVNAGNRPPDRAVVEIGPVPRPQRFPDARGFVLDVHLGTLARRLRILGIDTDYRNDADDDTLVREATEHRRVLLTQDRGLLMRRAVRAGAYVRGRRPDDQLADVLDRFEPPLHPWSRCTACNGPLTAVGKDEVIDRLEPGTRCRYEDFALCRRCGQVYWHGAHSRRLDPIVDAARSAVRPRRGT
ncbi:Mut7-C RNAse domain-containing protein [Pseudonocardia hispaniensis]|uniref:Mut7-C RNAse domain-containing protein n=1 Tax=Pseudonocardia hispaniensis TaxID=904933 RepID=A0ABW1J5Z0_9PSEU